MGADENRITTFCARLGDGSAVFAAKLALIAAIYFGLAKLGFNFAFDHSSVSAFWPPAGFALAALILCGQRFWPAIAVGAFTANVANGLALDASAGIALGNTLEAVVGAYLLSNVGFRSSLERLRDVVQLAIYAAILSTVISATIGVFSLWAFAGLSVTDLAETWRIWWLGDVSGVLLIAPVLLILAAGTLPKLTRARAAEAMALGVVLAAVTIFVFTRPTGLPFLVFPLLIVAALRYWQLGAALGGLLVSVIAVWLTSRGNGLFANFRPDEAVVSAQVFASVASLTGLLAAAIRSERRETASAFALAAANERKLEEAQKLAHLGSWEWDVNTNHVRWSSEMYRIFDLDPGDFTGEPGPVSRPRSSRRPAAGNSRHRTGNAEGGSL